MNPGDMCRNRCFLDFYPTAESVNRRIPDDGIPMGSIFIILTPPNGTWIKVLSTGRIGWVNWTFLEDIWDETG